MSTRKKIGSQRSEVRGQRSEVRGRRSEVRGQRSEVRGRRSEAEGEIVVGQDRFSSSFSLTHKFKRVSGVTPRLRAAERIFLDNAFSTG